MATRLPDKVTAVSTSYGHPFRNLKQPDLKHGGDAETPIKSKVETTISGRRVFRPVRK